MKKLLLLMMVSFIFVASSLAQGKNDHNPYQKKRLQNNPTLDNQNRQNNPTTLPQRKRDKQSMRHQKRMRQNKDSYLKGDTGTYPKNNWRMKKDSHRYLKGDTATPPKNDRSTNDWNIRRDRDTTSHQKRKKKYHPRNSNTSNDWNTKRRKDTSILPKNKNRKSMRIRNKMKRDTNRFLRRDTMPNPRSRRPSDQWENPTDTSNPKVEILPKKDLPDNNPYK